MISGISTQTNPLANQTNPVNNNQSNVSEKSQNSVQLSSEQAQALMHKITQAKPSELLSAVNVTQQDSNQTFSLMA